MACKKLKIKQPDGTFSHGFICGDFEHDLNCRICGCFADKLCDYPVGNDKTCDSAMCQDCAVHIKGDLDYCPEHATEYGKILYINRLQYDGSGI